MSSDQIVTDPERLSVRSRETDFKECIRLKLFERLPMALQNAWTPGVGLAAVQIGVPLRFAYYRDDSKPLSPPVFILNPRILFTGNMQPHRNEGCLSVPNARFQTWRYLAITYEKLVNGKMVQFDAKGLEAIIIQHEIDHMDGILCRDKVFKPRDLGRNEACPCASGLKYKKCCMKARGGTNGV